LFPSRLRPSFTSSSLQVTEEVTGQQFALRFQFRAGEFFQNNPFVLPRLVDHVVAEARQPLKAAAAAASAGGKVATHLIDAYCGGGLFCLAAAAHFEQCAGIEISALNIASAQRNAALNG
jgi:23S rRNA (uracil1939-C5)-methyltransferase/tRNA (uracil-5-)-methyltransferase